MTAVMADNSYSKEVAMADASGYVVQGRLKVGRDGSEGEPGAGEAFA